MQASARPDPNAGLPGAQVSLETGIQTQTPEHRSVRIPLDQGLLHSAQGAERTASVVFSAAAPEYKQMESKASSATAGVSLTLGDSPAVDATRSVNDALAEASVTLASTPPKNEEQAVKDFRKQLSSQALEGRKVEESRKKWAPWKAGGWFVAAVLAHIVGIALLATGNPVGIAFLVAGIMLLGGVHFANEEKNVAKFRMRNMDSIQTTQQIASRDAGYRAFCENKLKEMCGPGPKGKEEDSKNYATRTQQALKGQTKSLHSQISEDVLIEHLVTDTNLFASYNSYNKHNSKSKKSREEIGADIENSFAVHGLFVKEEVKQRRIEEAKAKAEAMRSEESKKEASGQLRVRPLPTPANLQQDRKDAAAGQPVPNPPDS